MDVKKTLFIALLMATLTACKSGDSSNSDSTAPGPTNPGPTESGPTDPEPNPDPVEQALQ